MADRQASSKRRSTADLVRLYLQDIGRVDLLSHEEELTLARLVQRREQLLVERRGLCSKHPDLARLEALEEQRLRETSRLGHQPSQNQWAQAFGNFKALVGGDADVDGWSEMGHDGCSGE